MARKKVLVVEDDPTCMALIRSGLSSAGYDVIAAQNGEEGFGKLCSEKPDLVITDVMMPGLTGLQFFERLKAQADLRNIPVVVMSSREGFKEFFPPWQIADFVRKPFTLTEIVGKVAGLLGASADGTRPPTALVICVEDFVTSRMREFLESQQYCVHTAYNGEEAVVEARKSCPNIIFAQTIVDSEDLMPSSMLRKLQNDPAMQGVPFVAFSSENRAGDPAALTGVPTVITYGDCDELIAKVGAYLKEFQAAPRAPS